MLKKSISLWKVTLFISLFITIFGNFTFWRNFVARITVAEEPILALSFFIVIFAFTNILLTIVSFKPVFKIIAIVILITSASTAYFMDNYAVMIDKEMIRNVLGTNYHEATELFSWRLLIASLLLGILPSIALLKMTIHYQPFFKGLLQKMGILFICMSVIIGTLYANYQEISFFSRENRELRHFINPTNYLFSLKSILKEQLNTEIKIVKPIENDAKTRVNTDKDKKPSLVILVLGETARAMNFSFNGYQRDTNPLLAKQEVINFSNVSSCGTATAVSVPCMFSKFTRSDFSYSKGKAYENLLDVVNHAGYEVLWRNNNTGCQGVCERVSYENLANKDTAEYCHNGNCVDEILLQGLQGVINQEKKDRFIVLHQKGNHGPTYHLRYPKKFEVFKPACKTNQLRFCSNEEVVNAYDNAILYSDYFLDKTIDLLKQNSRYYNTAMVYISDHGESLGENNIFLHGLPYSIAPDFQKKVPFMLWLSKQYQQTHGINQSCVVSKSSEQLSHDNFFSSMLGLLAIDTNVHADQLDIFNHCKVP